MDVYLERLAGWLAQRQALAIYFSGERAWERISGYEG
jgi:hypothetical protein